MPRPKLTPKPLVLLALCLAATLAGCSVPAADDPDRTPSAEEQAALEELAADEEEAAATRDFAVRLLGRCVTEDPGSNVLVSPLSTLYALALLENGAAGETLAQLEAATGLSRDDLTAHLARTPRSPRRGRLTSRTPSGCATTPGSP